jgi:hypothetical protein
VSLADKEDDMAGIRQRPPASATRLHPDDRLSAMLARAEAALAEPFVGVRTNEGIRDGSYTLFPTGVPTGPITEAAASFLDALDPARRAKASFPLEDDAWRRWSNIHRFLMRHGIGLRECSAEERDRALGVLAASLSEGGFREARDVMRLNGMLGELTGLSGEFGEWLYWLSIFGTPSEDEPWGFQFDGHHLNVNCLVIGDQVVMTPYFLGSEPVEADSGAHRGTRVLESEETAAITLMAALSPSERKKAVVADELPRELFTIAFSDNAVLDYAGICYDDLGTAAKSALLDLVGRYVARMRPGHAAVKMAEIEAHLSDTWFAWMGGTDADSVFYYRVQSPVVLIEFDHQAGIVFDNDEPTRRHIHTVMRTPNGNDYGKDLLRLHYEQFDHAAR